MSNSLQHTSAKQSKNERIESFLKDKYCFRYNSIKSRTELKTQTDLYVPVTKFIINSIRRQIDTSIGIVTSADNIRAILESDFSPRVNPIQEYFKTLPKIDINATSFIDTLSGCVSVTNPNKWGLYFRKWLVGVVANAMIDNKCCNHTCLVLAGEQGKLKTTFLDMLCPNSLKNYLFTGKIDPQSKDVQMLMAEYLFINIDDQLRDLNKKNENELKNLITAPMVKYRRPYDIYIEEYPHLASFMASVNGNDYLTDPTGNRRFLSFEVVNIDIQLARTIDMDMVYSEAFYLFKEGYRYWFNDEEIAELHKENEGFQVQTTEYEMLIKGFQKPTKYSESYMSTSEILNYLRSFTTLNLSEKKMGEAIRKAGFERISKRIGNNPMYVYRIEKISPCPFIASV